MGGGGKLSAATAPRVLRSMRRAINNYGVANEREWSAGCHLWFNGTQAASRTGLPPPKLLWLLPYMAMTRPMEKPPLFSLRCDLRHLVAALWSCTALTALTFVRRDA